MNCWVCGSTWAPWKVTAEKEKTEEEPAVVIEFHACDKCIPWKREEAAVKGAQTNDG